jgi:hypothetical protein
LIAKGDSFCSSRQMGRSLRSCGSERQLAWIASLFIACLHDARSWFIRGMDIASLALVDPGLRNGPLFFFRPCGIGYALIQVLDISLLIFLIVGFSISNKKENKGEQKTKNVHYLREGNIFARTCISMRTSGHQWQICFSNPNALFSCSPHYSIFYLLYRLPFSSGQFMEPPLLALVTQYFTAASMSWSDNYELTEILDLIKF